ncbi:MAG: hypothetical protein H0X50_12320 [Nitrosopumilus sp.]|nr:hypothetical protein [Nitrosopumilus sp.]
MEWSLQSDPNFPTGKFTGLDPKLKKQNLTFETGIPFVSQVSYRIAQIIEEKKLLEEDKQDLLKEFDDLDSKRYQA